MNKNLFKMSIVLLLSFTLLFYFNTAPVNAINTNSPGIWAGYQLSGSNYHFNEVIGKFVVPTVTASLCDSYTGTPIVSFWVGIGGATVAQTGITISCMASNAGNGVTPGVKPTIGGWYENTALGGPYPLDIGKVSAGDTIYADVGIINGVIYYNLEDINTGVTGLASQSTVSNQDYHTAEWCAEFQPGAAMPNFNQISWIDAWAWEATRGSKYLNEWNSYDTNIVYTNQIAIGNEHVWVNAGSIGTDGAFTMYYTYIYPNISPAPTGRSSGVLYQSYSFGFYGSNQINVYDVYFIINWGDGSSTTTSQIPSGSTGYFSHAYSRAGTFYISVLAMNTFHGITLSASSWSSSHSISIANIYYT